LGLFSVKCSILYQYLRFFVEKPYRRATWSLLGLTSVSDPAAPRLILSYITDQFATSVRWHGFPPHILLCLFAGQIFMGQVHSKRTLHQSEYLWLLLLRLQHLDRSRYLHLADASTLALATAKETKAQLDRGFCTRRVVGQAVPIRFKQADLLESAVITGIFRLHALYIATISKDLTYDNIDAATWSAAELNVAIMCASIPALRPVISMIFPRLLSSTVRNPSNTFPRSAQYGRSNKRSSYVRHDSVVELSNIRRVHSDVSRDDTISFDRHQYPCSIQIKNEGSIQESERV
jgi:hypothetical protein